MTKARRVAGIGMGRTRWLLREGATAHEGVATEALYAMLRAGAAARRST